MALRYFVYDDEKMSIDDYGINSIIRANAIPNIIECTAINGEIRQYMASMPERTIEFRINDYDHKIELDPTTMLKIAKYNKNIELKELNEELKNVKRKIKSAKEQQKKLEDMVPSLKELIKDYITSNCTDFDEYISNLYTRDDDYYDDY